MNHVCNLSLHLCNYSKGKEEIQSPQVMFIYGEMIRFAIVFENNFKQELL